MSDGRARLSGCVVRLVRERGFGFLKADSAWGNGEYFFHRSGCDVTSPFESLGEGCEVTFQTEDTGKGPRACAVRLAAAL